jgi:hypothetical protein
MISSLNQINRRIRSLMHYSHLPIPGFVWLMPLRCEITVADR